MFWKRKEVKTEYHVQTSNRNYSVQAYRAIAVANGRVIDAGPWRWWEFPDAYKKAENDLIELKEKRMQKEKNKNEQ